MEQTLTVRFEGSAVERVHVPVRSLLGMIEVLQQEIRKKCGRLHPIQTMCVLEIETFEAESSTAVLRLQGPPECERAWRSDDPLARIMAELERTAGHEPHLPGLLRCRLATCLGEGLEAVEIQASNCSGRQQIAYAERFARPLTPLKPEEKLANVDVEALDALLRG